MKPDSYDLLISKHAELSSIVAKCASENRAPSADEQAQLTLLKGAIDAIKSEWESSGRQAFLNSFPSSIQKAESGRVVLKSADSLAKHLEGTYSQEFKHLSLGKILRGYVTGEWANAELEQKAMASTPSSAGGILIPTPLAAEVIDLARNAARVLQAGAITVPMSTATLRYARLDSDVTPTWTAEAANIILSAASFDSVLFTAHKLATIVAIDNELLEDAENADATIQESIGKAIALALDYAALYGSGVAPQPLGLHGNVQAVPAGGAPNYDLMLTAIEEVQAANFNPNAVIYSPRTSTTLSKLKTTYGEYLMPPASFGGLQKLVTNQVPTNLGTGTNESQAFIGQWDQLALGLRSSLQIEVSREASYYDGTAVQAAFSRDQTVIRAILRADWQLLHAGAFAEVTGMTS